MANRESADHLMHVGPRHTTIAFWFLASALVYLGAMLVFIVAPHRIESDLTVFYYQWAVSLTPDTSPYPPFVLLAIKPLAYFSLVKAFWIWTAVNLLFFFSALILLVGRNPIMIALGIFYAPFVDGLFWGQSNPILLFALAVAVYCVGRRQYAVSSAAIAVAGFIKVFPFAVFGYFVAARRWKAVAWSLLAILTGVVLSVAVLGIELNGSFIVLLFSSQNPHCVFCPFWSIRKTDLSLTVGFAYLFTSARMVQMSALISTIGLMFLASYATWNRGRGRDIETCSLWAAVAMVLSPVNEFHHLLLLLIPFAGIVRNPRGTELWLVALSYVLAEVALIAMWMWWNKWEVEGEIWIWLTQFGALVTGLAASFVATGAFTHEPSPDPC